MANPIDGHAAAEQYEALRRGVVAPEPGGNADVRGLAVLLRKGVAAWMQGESASCARSTDQHAEVNGHDRSAASMPTARETSGMEAMLVNILAAMMSANTVEVPR